MPVNQNQLPLPPHHNQRLRKTLRNLITPPVQLIHIHLRLRRHQPVNRYHPAGKLRLHPVQRLQRLNIIKNLLRCHLLNLRPDHIRIRNNPDQLILTIHHRQLLNTEPEHLPCNIIHPIIRIRPQQHPLHQPCNRIKRRCSHNIPCRNKSHNTPLLIHHRKPVMRGRTNQPDHILHRPRHRHTKHMHRHIIRDHLLLRRNQSRVRRPHQRMLRTVIHLHIRKRIDVHRMCRPLQTKLNIRINRNHIRIKTRNTKPLCRHRPVMPVHQN